MHIFLKPGVLLDGSIIKSLKQSDKIDKKKLQEFILKRMKVNENGVASFFVYQFKIIN